MSHFLFRKQYESWLKAQNISESSIKSYCLQTKYPNSKLTFFDVIGAFIYNQENLYALAAYEKWKNTIDSSEKTSQKTKINHNDYIAKYRLFIESLLSKKKISISEDDKGRLDTKILSSLNSIREELNGSLSSDSLNRDNLQIDGMDILLSHIGKENFIRLALESSYFFDKEIVEKRFKDIAEYWNNPDDKKTDRIFEDNKLSLPYLPARFSSKYSSDIDEGKQKSCEDQAVFQLNGGKECRIFQDGYRGKHKKYYGGGNGNTRVCQLIKYLTGYDLGAKLNKKSFKNFIISHIWGHATDPRYFTNLWNIAIVPAWANHLLDKDETGTLSDMLKSSIKQIMIKYYGLDLEPYDWERINMNKDSICNLNYEELIPIEEIIINIIKEKENGQTFGSITKVNVKIK